MGVPAASTSQVFSVRGFEDLFPLTGTLGCPVSLTPHLFLQVYPHTNVGPPAPPATAKPGPLANASPSLVLQPPPCCKSSPPQLPISAPPTGLDECFVFISLVVILPYSSIFCQFCLFFVFKFVVILLLVVQGATVCLPTPPSWPEVSHLTMSVSVSLWLSLISL